MSQALLCPMCGMTVPVDVPGEACPACLMKLAFDGHAASKDRMLPPSAPAASVDTVAFASEASIRKNRAADAMRIPGYECLGELGRGGMGVVYKARHLDLKRLVALKMIVGADYASAEQIERFRREAEAVARLQHPNIVQIYEVGQSDGRPYFALEYVDGGSLADKLQGTPMAPTDAARVVETLAGAVHAAHQRGIVHRDLKPANVLLTTDGTPKIADFGLAKETDASSSRTQEGTVMGTPSYMAPEQAGGKVNAIGPAADTYALGAILYETLTGRPPFKGVTSLDTIMQVVSLEPARPRDVQPQVPRDLETICLKCLRKDPARRYANALELAEDLRRFQAGEPILARPTGSVERLIKWSRRRPMVAGLTAALLIMVGAAFGLMVWRLQETDRASGLERLGKEKAEQLARESDRAARLDREGKEKAEVAAQEANKRAEAEGRRAEAEKRLKQQADLAADEARRRREELAQAAFTAQIWRAAGLAVSDPVKALETLEDPQICPLERRDFTWRYQHQLSQRLVRRFAQKEEAGVKIKQIVPDGPAQKAGLKVDDLVIEAGASKVSDLESLQDAIHRRMPGDELRFKVLRGKDTLDLKAVLAKPPVGTELSDRRVFLGVMLENVSRGGALSPDGKVLATQTADNNVRLWDFATGTPGLLLRADHGSRVNFAFSPDSKTLATGYKGGEVKLWDVKTGELKTTLKWDIPDGPPRLVQGLAFHPDGKSLTVCGHYYDQEREKKNLDEGFRFFVVWTWDLASGAGKLLTSHSNAQFKDFWFKDTGLNQVVYSADGKSLAAGTTRGSTVFILDPATGALRQNFRAEAGFIGGIAFSPDGKQLAYGNSTGNVFLCDLAAGKIRHRLFGHTQHVDCCNFTADGTLVTGAYDGMVRIWDVGSGQLRTVLRSGGRVTCMSLLRGGKELLVVTAREAQVWSLQVAAPATTVSIPRPGNQPRPSAVAINAEGTRLAAVGQDDKIRLWEITRKLTGPLKNGVLSGHKGRTTAIAFGPADSRLLVSGAEDRQILLWRLDGPGPASPSVLGQHTGTVTFLAVTPDGKSVISGSSDDGSVRMWDLDSPGKDNEARNSKCEFKVDGARITTAALSRDGKRLVTGDATGQLHVWDVPKHLLVATPSGQKQGLDRLILTSDGNLAASVVGGGFVVLHDLSADDDKGQKKDRPIGSDNVGPGPIAFTPDGKTLAVANRDRFVRLYDVASGDLRCELPVYSHNVYALTFSADGTLLATLSLGHLRWDSAGEIKLWVADAPTETK
jgi:WD40 repeat protein